MTDNKVAPPAWIVSAEMLSVHSDLYIFSFSVQSHLQNTCCMHCSLPNNIKPKYTQQLSKVISYLFSK